MGESATVYSASLEEGVDPGVENHLQGRQDKGLSDRQVPRKPRPLETVSQYEKNRLFEKGEGRSGGKDLGR